MAVAALLPFLQSAAKRFFGITPRVADDVVEASVGTATQVAREVPATIPPVAEEPLVYLDALQERLRGPGPGNRAAIGGNNPPEDFKIKPPQTDIDATGLFSPTLRMLNESNKIPEKGTGQQFAKPLLRGDGQQSKIAEEMKDIGLDKFLLGQEKLTKKEVVDYVNENKIEYEETTLAEGNTDLEYDNRKTYAEASSRFDFIMDLEVNQNKYVSELLPILSHSDLMSKYYPKLETRLQDKAARQIRQEEDIASVAMWKKEGKHSSEIQRLLIEQKDRPFTNLNPLTVKQIAELQKPLLDELALKSEIKYIKAKQKDVPTDEEVKDYFQLGEDDYEEMLMLKEKMIDETTKPINIKDEFVKFDEANTKYNNALEDFTETQKDGKAMYTSYTMPGGTNKEERLFKLKGQYSIGNFRDSGRHYGDKGKGMVLSSRGQSHNLLSKEEMAWRAKASELQNEYEDRPFSAAKGALEKHMDSAPELINFDPKITGHLMDEAQNMIYQEGRREGFRPKFPKIPEPSKEIARESSRLFVETEKNNEMLYPFKKAEWSPIKDKFLKAYDLDPFSEEIYLNLEKEQYSADEVLKNNPLKAMKELQNYSTNYETLMVEEQLLEEWLNNSTPRYSTANESIGNWLSKHNIKSPSKAYQDANKKYLSSLNESIAHSEKNKIIPDYDPFFVEFEDYAPELIKYNKELDKIPPEEKTIDNSILADNTKVPNVPAKKSNLSQTIKLEIIKAAREDHDYFMWTPGEVHGRRYPGTAGQLKSVSSVEFIEQSAENAAKNGPFRLQFFDLDDNFLEGKYFDSLEEIQTLLGEKSFKKLMEDNTKIKAYKAKMYKEQGEQSKFYEYRPDLFSPTIRNTALKGNSSLAEMNRNPIVYVSDLEIGGEGMKAYYDKDVMNRVKAIMKRLDPKSKVEVVTIDNGFQVWGVKLTKAMKEIINKLGLSMYTVPPLTALGLSTKQMLEDSDTKSKEPDAI